MTKFTIEELRIISECIMDQIEFLNTCREIYKGNENKVEEKIPKYDKLEKLENLKEKIDSMEVMIDGCK